MASGADSLSRARSVADTLGFAPKPSKEVAMMRAAHLAANNEGKGLLSAFHPMTIFWNALLESAIVALELVRDVVEPKTGTISSKVVDLSDPTAIAQHILNRMWKPLVRDAFVEQTQRFIDRGMVKTVFKDKPWMHKAFTRDTSFSARRVIAARSLMLPAGASFGDRVAGRLEAIQYYAVHIGSYPAVTKAIGHVLWDLGELFCHQIALARARHEARKRLAEEPDQDSTGAIQARVKMSKLNSRILSFQGVVEKVFLIVRWGVASAMVQVLGGSVGTLLWPGKGTYVGEIAPGFFLEKPGDDLDWSDISLAGF